MCSSDLLIEQVLLNLMKNAIDAMRGQDHAALTLQVSATRDNVLFAVADQGPGIPEEQQEKVFEAFFTTKPEGMGMGLNICRSIIESHAGRLWVESNQPRVLFLFRLYYCFCFRQNEFQNSQLTFSLPVPFYLKDFPKL